MKIHVTILCLLCGLCLTRPAHAAGDPDEAIDKWVAQHHDSQGRPSKLPYKPTQATDETLAKLLPSHVFYVFVVREYPVARQAPVGLADHNIFAVDPQGEVQDLTDAKGLEKFFHDNLVAVKDEATAKSAVRAWLALSQNLVQDGMYRFTIPDDGIHVEAHGPTLTATGKAVVDPAGGNRGQVLATLNFDADGKLLQAQQEASVRPGVRPICQATKLLDPDPIVRRMAEQDLLIMGSSARDYIVEQRAKAAPALQEAIDRIWRQIQDNERQEP